MKTDATQNASFSSMSDDIASNLARIDVYYETLDLMEIIESPTFSFTSFLSALGGAVSLILGVSLASALEFVVMFVKFFASMCTSRTKK